MGTLALAASQDLLGAAWVSFDGILQFAYFNSELELLGQFPCGEKLNVFPLALAASGEGWILAMSSVGDDPELTILYVSDQGQPSEVRRIAGASSPVLAEVPGEPPLLVYASTDTSGSINTTLVAERLDDSGQSVWDVELGDGLRSGAITAAFGGSGFVVGGYSADTGQHLFPIDADGQLGADVLLPDVGGLQLAAGDDDRVAASWQDAEGYEFAWLDGSGQLIGDPLLLAPPDPTQLVLDRALTVSAGDAIVAIAADAGKEVRVFHVDSSGTLAVPGYALARGPISTTWLTATTDSRDNAVFGWSGTSLVLSQVH
jgi:hypothetical protein